MYIDINAGGCPNTCRHCSADGHLPYGRLFSLEELRAIKTEWGPLTIRFEPTAHPDFPEIYHSDIAIEHGGWLVTNGFGLARREDYGTMLTRMQEMGLHTVAFTLHGLREHHDWFVCRTGAFDDILRATRRVKKAGFTANWQIFVDRRGIEDIPGLIEIAIQECGRPPELSLPYHRVGGRTKHYEKIRPRLQDIEKLRLTTLINDPGRNYITDPEALTARAWLKKWRAAPESDEFKHPFEPRCWPASASFEALSLRISQDRKVYFDPLCAGPICLGKLSDGRDAILDRLERLPTPLFANLNPEDVNLPHEQEVQLHPAGFSLRYLEISKYLRRNRNLNQSLDISPK
jgi:MoaA/NifB/PqqE/SkfB family radical SAM enzyme